MRKTNKLKQQIDNILTSSKSPNQMLEELNFNKVAIRQIGGNINMLKTLNNKLVEKIWRSLKLVEFLSNSKKELKKLGVSQSVIKNHYQLMNQFDLNNLTEEPTDEKYLEIEVFSEPKLTVN